VREHARTTRKGIDAGKTRLCPLQLPADGVRVVQRALTLVVSTPRDASCTRDCETYTGVKGDVEAAERVDGGVQGGLDVLG
jgi:hypothetical protein